MSRLPKGVLIPLQKETGIHTTHLSAYISGARTPSPKRAEVLGKACHKLGYDIPKEKWLWGTAKERKIALSHRPDRRSGTDRRKGERRECDQSEQILPAT